MAKLWSFLTIIILITLHLKIATIGGNFGISLALLLIPIWFIYTFSVKYEKFYINELILIFIFFLLPFLPLNISNWGEFFKTYGQYIISAFFVIRTYKKPLKIRLEDINNTLYYFQLILCIVVTLQYIMVHFLGVNSFYNLFGDSQLYYQLDVVIGKGRMKGFYLEPSYLGFVAVNLFWTRLYLDKSKKLVNFNLGLTFIILLLAQSAFAYISMFILILYEFFFEKLQRRSNLYKLISVVVFFVVLGLFSKELVSLLRLNEFSSQTEGRTSGFMRVILPFELLYKLWKDGYYFGLTFGQLDAYAFKLFREYGESAISNSFFSIMAYFGLISIPIYGACIYLFVKTKNKIVKSFIILSFFNLNNSGAFMTLQYAFIAFLIPLLAIKLNDQKSFNNYSSSK